MTGALVWFMGSNAHWAGLLAAAPVRRADAERWLGRSLDVHRRLGARAWEARRPRTPSCAATGDARLERGPSGWDARGPSESLASVAAGAGV